MNNRIYDLAEKVIVKYPTSDEWVFTHDELAKFAESIIQDCVLAVMEGDRYRRDYFADKIRRRFEIE